MFLCTSVLAVTVEAVTHVHIKCRLQKESRPGASLTEGSPEEQRDLRWPVTIVVAPLQTVPHHDRLFIERQ